MRFNKFENVRIREAKPDANIPAGSKGRVVEVFKGGAMLHVEIFDSTGATLEFVLDEPTAFEPYFESARVPSRTEVSATITKGMFYGNNLAIPNLTAEIANSEVYSTV